MVEAVRNDNQYVGMVLFENDTSAQGKEGDIKHIIQSTLCM